MLLMLSMRFAIPALLLLLTSLAGPSEAMSLSVSICYQMGDNAKTVQCLRDSFHEAVEANNIEEKNAALRLGEARGRVLIATQKSWLAAMAERCKAHLRDDIIETAEGTDFECMIDETQRRSSSPITPGAANRRLLAQVGKPLLKRPDQKLIGGGPPWRNIYSIPFSSTRAPSSPTVVSGCSARKP
jgi:uncharacterized protein YecT (DUF1311 family)